MKRFDVTKETYSVDELAAKLDISGTAVRMWLRDGTIKGIKVKRRWFIPADEVHKILAQAGYEVPQRAGSMIIVVGGLKGGTGKTTLATNLAAMHVLNHFDVVLVDADRQASAAFWGNLRDNAGDTPRVPCFQKRGDGLGLELKELASKYETIIVDAGGYEHQEMKLAMTVADLFIIPTNPSQFDLAGLEMIVPIVLECRVFNPGLETLTVINRAHPNPNASEIKDTKVFVSEIKHVTLFETIIRDRIVFRKAAREGKSVVEVKPIDPRANSEIQSFYTEVFNRGKLHASASGTADSS